MNPQYTIQFGHPDDPELKASPTHWKDFLRSLTWEDMRNFLNDRVTVIQNEMLIEPDPEQIRQKQMEAQACKMMLELPNQMLEWSKEQEELGGTKNGNP